MDGGSRDPSAGHDKALAGRDASMDDKRRDRRHGGRRRGASPVLADPSLTAGPPRGRPLPFSPRRRSLAASPVAPDPRGRPTLRNILVLAALAALAGGAAHAA